MEAYGASVKRGFCFTFVTPPVTDEGLEKLEGLFAFLASKGNDTEVVVNDWGVLRMLHQKGAHLKPVIGRLLDKLLREPRKSPLYDPKEIPEGSLLALQQSGITSPHYRQFLKSFDIDRVELDNPSQGIRMDFKAIGLKPSIHIPYGYVTSGRICLFGALNQPKEKKFTSSTPCQKECLRYVATLTDSSHPGNTSRLLQRGNTTFYQQEEEMLEKALVWSKEHGARVVLHSSPFDGTAYATEDVELARKWLNGRYNPQKHGPHLRLA